jgi:hypothetical protein
MPAVAWQLPIWICETCDEVGCSPVIFNSTVIEPVCLVIVMIPVAAVLMPLSLKVSPAGDGVGDGDGLEAIGVGAGDVDGDDTVSDAPQAATPRTTAASATNLTKLEFSDHLYPRALPVKVT